MRPETRRLRRDNQDLTRDLVRRWAALWPALDMADLDSSFPRWAVAAAALVGRYRVASAARAAEYLAELTGFRAVMPSPLELARFTTSMHVTTVAAVKIAMRNGASLSEASARGFSASTGSASRLVLDAGRETLTRTAVADPGCRGWQRVGEGECDFCQILISRGAVYTADSADFQAHDGCHCTAEPVYESGSAGADASPEDERGADAWVDELPTKSGDIPDDREARYLQLLQDDGEIGPPGSDSYERMSDAVRTNPQYASGADEYRGNCTHTVTANEFRRRGFDVEAAPLHGGAGRTAEDWLQGRWRTSDGQVPDLTPVNIYAADKRTRRDSFLSGLLEDLGEQPDGSRGVIQVQWTTGGGHVLNWERDDKVPGKVWLSDPQSGVGDRLARASIGKGSTERMGWVRMDDKVPQESVKEFLKY